MSFIVLFIVFLYSVGFTTKVQFSINSNATLMNYGNSKNSGTRSEYVLRHAVLGNVSWEKHIKNIKQVPEGAAKVCFNHSWICSRNYCNSKKRRVGSKYVLSYALFGKNSWQKYGKYVKNAAERAAKSPLYHNWTVRLYHDLYPEDLQNNLIKTYKRLEFCDIRSLVLPFSPDMNISIINGMTWRFIPMADPSVDIMCSRDLDSVLYKREEDAVNYWMGTETTLHTMRDHPNHNLVILGGMWCYRTKSNLTRATEILELMLKNAGKRNSLSEATKGDDQDMLHKYLWPRVKYDSIQHDSYLCKSFSGSIPYPSQRLTNHDVIGAMGEYVVPECPKDCRPKDHEDWLYC